MVDNLPVLPLDLFPLTIKWKQLEALLTTCALPMVSGGWHRSRCYCLDTKRGLTKNMTPHIDLNHPRCGALGRVLHIQKGWDNDLLTPAIIIPEMINYPRVLVSFYRRQEFLEISCPTLNYCCCCCCSWCCCSLATGMLMSGSGRGSGSLIWCTTDTVLFPINSYSKWYFEMSVLGSPGTATPRF